MTKNEILNSDLEFRYQLLGRMVSDCKYCISINVITNLWGITVSNHIDYMKFIWKSFPSDFKPEWCTYNDILNYEKSLNKI